MEISGSLRCSKFPIFDGAYQALRMQYNMQNPSTRVSNLLLSRIRLYGKSISSNLPVCSVILLVPSIRHINVQHCPDKLQLWNLISCRAYQEIALPLLYKTKYILVLV